MLESAKDAVDFLGDMSEEELVDNRLVLNAITRAIGIIGEAGSRISKEYRASRSEIPWENIIGMRNRAYTRLFQY